MVPRPKTLQPREGSVQNPYVLPAQVTKEQVESLLKWLYGK